MSILRAFYNMGWILFMGIAPLLALFSDKFRRWWRKRTVILPMPPSDRPVLWMHCASAGEFEQGRPILEYIAQQLSPRPYIVVSFFSPSGWERYQQSYPLADWIGPLPPDLPWKARQWTEALHPVAAFFVKYDLWPNLLQALKDKAIPTYLLSAHTAPYRGLHWVWNRGLLRFMTHIFVQTAEDKRRLQDFGFSNVTVAGDSRAWRVQQIRDQWIPVSGIQEWIGQRLCLIAGSVWEEDIRFLAQAYAQLRGLDLRWILVPHEVKPKMIDYMQRTWPTATSLYSQPKWPAQHNTLIIDKVGLLAYLYAYAGAVWIGGGFGAGIHNILEAAVYGKLVFFGPNYERFPEACHLIRSGVAESCKYPSAFSNAIRAISKDRRRLKIVEGKMERYFADLPNTRQIVWETLAPTLQAIQKPNEREGGHLASSS
jgi:3-deoxy-D-manno-octulosonic-acid transferase